MGEATGDLLYNYTSLLIHWADKLRDHYESDETGRLLRMQVAVRLAEDQAMRFMLAAGRDAWSPMLGLIDRGMDLAALMDACGMDAWATLASHEVNAMRMLVNQKTTGHRSVALDLRSDLGLRCSAWFLVISHARWWRPGLATNKTGQLRLSYSLKWATTASPLMAAGS